MADLLDLPQEIVDDIVDNLQDDRAILITLLPVSRSLRSRTQVYLFRVIKIKHILDLNAFTALCCLSTEIPKLVKTLHLHLDFKFTSTAFETLCRLVNVDTLYLNSSNAPIKRDVLDVLSPLSLTTLVLRHVALQGDPGIHDIFTMFPRIKRFSAYSVSVDSYAIDERHEGPHLDELCLYDSSTLLSVIPPSVFRGLRKLSIEGSISQDATQRLMDVTRTTLRELCFVNLCLEQRGWGAYNGLDISNVQSLTLRVHIDGSPFYFCFTDLVWLDNALSKMQGDAFLTELHIIFQTEDIHLLIVEGIKHPRMTGLWGIMSRIAAAPRMASLRELRITLTAWKGPQEILLDETSYLEAWEEKLRLIFNDFSPTKAFDVHTQESQSFWWEYF
ncbi:hypothetical protein ARMSODRAFT_428151 [Armillaria solidipes]|uniref:F-box domain-containing protein n=1 Tax=Armillaria solidipes TaxID=1076256 RepID=A0A2H3C4D2_9AGAR|nr:hypothetical protein ARMSODRAFT_428151 [Armillaria solidipes]